MLPAQLPFPLPILSTLIEEALPEPLAAITSPITSTDSPTCGVSADETAFGGRINLYVVPALSVMVKFGSLPPRQPSVIGLFVAGVWAPGAVCAEPWPALPGTGDCD